MVFLIMFGRLLNMSGNRFLIGFKTLGIQVPSQQVIGDTVMICYVGLEGPSTF